MLTKRPAIAAWLVVVLSRLHIAYVLFTVMPSMGAEPTTEIDPTEAVEDITVQAVTVSVVVVICNVGGAVQLALASSVKPASNRPSALLMAPRTYSIRAIQLLLSCRWTAVLKVRDLNVDLVDQRLQIKLSVEPPAFNEIRSGCDADLSPVSRAVKEL
jgi:hypothetical protein